MPKSLEAGESPAEGPLSVVYQDGFDSGETSAEGQVSVVCQEGLIPGSPWQRDNPLCAKMACDQGDFG